MHVKSNYNYSLLDTVLHQMKLDLRPVDQFTSWGGGDVDGDYRIIFTIVILVGVRDSFSCFLR